MKRNWKNSASAVSLVVSLFVLATIAINPAMADRHRLPGGVIAKPPPQTARAPAPAPTAAPTSPVVVPGTPNPPPIAAIRPKKKGGKPIITAPDGTMWRKPAPAP